MKGIKITADNRNQLAHKFNVEIDDYADVLPIGYWCLSYFGDHLSFETVTQETFEEFWSPGEKLENGWYDLTDPVVEEEPE